MENFNLKKFLVENKLTTNSKLLNEVDEFVKIANNVKRIASDAEALIRTINNAVDQDEKFAGINRERVKNPEQLEQQIEVVEDAIEDVRDYAGDSFASDIEDIAKDNGIPELQARLKRLIEEADKLDKMFGGGSLEENVLSEGWKNWALGTVLTLSALGGGTAQAATGADTVKPGVEIGIQQGRFDKSWEAIKSSLKSTNPRLIVSKDYMTEVPFESLNWGTAGKGAGKAKGGIVLQHTKGSKTVELKFFSDSNPEVKEQLLVNAKKAGIQLTSQGRMATAEIAVDQASKIASFIEASLPILQGTPSKLTVGGGPDIGSNTGQIKGGPVATPAGSVKVGGKSFTGQ